MLHESGAGSAGFCPRPESPGHPPQNRALAGKKLPCGFEHPRISLRTGNRERALPCLCGGIFL